MQLGVANSFFLLCLCLLAARLIAYERLIRAYRACRNEVKLMMLSKAASPILLRLAWSDAGTYDCMVKGWPECGGVNGSILFDSEMYFKGNAGLSKAAALLAPVKKRYPQVSWADLIQMAGVRTTWWAEWGGHPQSWQLRLQRAVRQ